MVSWGDFIEMPVKYSASASASGWCRRLERLESTRLLLDFKEENDEMKIYEAVCYVIFSCTFDKNNDNLIRLKKFRTNYATYSIKGKLGRGCKG